MVSRLEPTPRDEKDALLRVGAVAASALLAGALFYRHTDAWVAGQPMWMFAALLYGLAIGLTAAVVFRFAPKLGPFVEYTALSRLVFAGATLPYPALAASMTASPVLNASLVVGGATLLQALLGGRGVVGIAAGRF